MWLTHTILAYAWRQRRSPGRDLNSAPLECAAKLQSIVPRSNLGHTPPPTLVSSEESETIPGLSTDAKLAGKNKYIIIPCLAQNSSRYIKILFIPHSEHTASYAEW